MIDQTTYLVLFGFTQWQLKILRNVKKKIIEEANWVGGLFFCSHPVFELQYFIVIKDPVYIYRCDIFTNLMTVCGRN